MLKINRQVELQQIHDWGIKVKLNPVVLQKVNIRLKVFSGHPKDVAKVTITDSSGYHKDLKVRNYQAKELQEFCEMMGIDLSVDKVGKRTNETESAQTGY